MFSDKIKNFPQFMKKVFYEHDISKLGFDINQTQTNILMLVSENSEKSMSEISAITGLEKSSFTRSVDSLVRSGLITRNPSDSDRRIVRLYLTNKGGRAAKLIKNDFNNYLETLIAGFSEDEKKEFMNSLAVTSKYIDMIINGGKQ